jgi:hypothetical protein
MTPVGKPIRRVQPGETLYVTEREARVLAAIRRARRLETAELVPVASEPEPEVEISPRTGKPKRRYRRRDMSAER